MNNIKFYFICLFSLLLFSCESKHEEEKEPILLNIEGTWNVYYQNKQEGIIEFDNQDNFYLEKIDSPALFGNYLLNPNTKRLNISYVEDENGEQYMPDNIWNCSISVISNNEYIVTNLPYYENKTVTLKK